MQVNPINNTSFGARIVPSEYLNKAIELAKTDAQSGTEQGLKSAATFYNSLKTIEMDKTKSKLLISDADKNMPPILSLDGTRRIVELYRDVENKLGRAVQEAINSMAEIKYFRGEIKNYAQKENLTKAFDKWVM